MDRRWIVDASNVVGSRPDGWWRDRPAALHRLLDEIVRWRAETGEPVLVVADGHPMAQVPEGTHGGVHVRYAHSSARDAADDEIVRILAGHFAPETIVVATSDRDLAERVRSYGAGVEGAAHFRRRITGDDSASIRPAAAADEEFLRRMLAVAADWRHASPVRSVEEVLATPELAHYVVGWPRAGDFGVVSHDDDGRPVGAAWARCFSADDPGYGFVAPEVPEVSIGVVSDSRGRGIGRRLLVRLVEEARSRDVDQLSLSVALENRAMGLYASIGFVVVAESDGAATMVLDVARALR